jgi:hypothetical protein
MEAGEDSLAIEVVVPAAVPAMASGVEAGCSIAVLDVLPLVGDAAMTGGVELLVAVAELPANAVSELPVTPTPQPQW